jgi:hypothetical protein
MMSRRLKRTLIVTAVVVAMLPLGVAIWIAVNSHDVAQPDTSDLRIEAVDVPDEDNASTYFRKAAEVFQWRTDDPCVSAIVFDRTWNDAFVNDLLSRNAETLALLEQGLACSAYEPGLASTDRKPEPSFLWWGDVSWLVTLKAMRDRRAGQTEDVWQCCFDELQLGSDVATHPRAEIEYGSGLVVLGRGLSGAEDLLRQSPVSEAELIRLLDRLNSVGPLEQGQIRAAKEDFRFIAESVDQGMARPGRTSLVSSYPFQPNRTKDGVARLCRVMIENASRPYGEAHLLEAKPLPKTRIRRYLLFLRRNSVGELLTRMFVTPERVRNPLLMGCKVGAYLDGLRLVVACRLYEVRHGRLPETLDALVPALLREVPRDPYDGQPFRYLPDKGIVYCVGTDLKDSSSTGVEVIETRSGRHLAAGDDQVYAIHE